jgi:uncharacterized protein YecT (DUF1311 family)
MRGLLVSRGQSCSVEASRFAGGSAHAIALLNCTLDRHKSHLADLTAMRKTFAQR